MWFVSFTLLITCVFNVDLCLRVCVVWSVGCAFGFGWFVCWWWCALFLTVVKLAYCSYGSLVGTWDWLGVH